jgi:hypothetical protein
LQTPAKEGERFLNAEWLTEVYHPAPNLDLTNPWTVAKKCPVPDPAWIMVNVNNLSGKERLLISLINFSQRQ